MTGLSFPQAARNDAEASIMAPQIDLVFMMAPQLALPT